MHRITFKIIGNGGKSIQKQNSSFVFGCSLMIPKYSFHRNISCCTLATKSVQITIIPNLHTTYLHECKIFTLHSWFCLQSLIHHALEIPFIICLLDTYLDHGIKIVWISIDHQIDSLKIATFIHSFLHSCTFYNAFCFYKRKSR